MALEPKAYPLRWNPAAWRLCLTQREDFLDSRDLADFRDPGWAAAMDGRPWYGFPARRGSKRPNPVI